MKKKVGMLILWIVLVVVCGVGIWQFDKNNIGLGGAVAGAFITIFIEKARGSLQDLNDTTNWKTSQRRLVRGGFIKNDDIIRISFAYLYRIKIGNKYLLVQNTRNRPVPIPVRSSSHG